MDSVQEVIDGFEGKAIAAIMDEGFDRAEAEAMLNDWVARKAKRIQVQKLLTKFKVIR